MLAAWRSDPGVDRRLEVADRRDLEVGDRERRRAHQELVHLLVRVDVDDPHAAAADEPIERFDRPVGQPLLEPVLLRGQQVRQDAGRHRDLSRCDHDEEFHGADHLTFAAPGGAA
jgi:hypothetical protein